MVLIMNRLVVLLLAGIMLVSAVSAEKQIVIGAIIDESGDTTSYAPGIETAINLAASDLNDYYKKVNKTTTVVIKKESSDGTSESAAKAAENLVSEGAQIIVGPTTSEELSGCLPILSREKILSINPSSSIKLAIPGDQVIRLCPGDLSLVNAIASYNTVITGTIPQKTVVVSRGDLYGLDLSEKVKSITQVSDTVIYSPRTRDFTSTLEKLNSSVSSLIDTYGEKNVCVFAISIDEISDLLAQASAYPNLRKIQWSGMDGVALNPTILKNDTAAQFAYDTHLATISFNVAQPEDSNYWKVYDKIQATTDGHQPCIYEILPYDEVVMAARILENNASTLEDTLKIVDILGNNMYGATGWLKLDKNGDREHGDYYFYLPQKGADGTIKWVPCFAYLDGLNTTIPLIRVNNTLLEKTLAA
ncbi:hypothetical protein DK846_00395 [Methanospirillum lacunae]|uniref:Receptor ligand binding region domain-containing protein n=2 Tax=Methanospirillum lacunae TaxID=668570 RepID=A0A2V2NHD5_9EURY|nr:hypothetical protein DK846_00395 [Methanospirillum lacunae]